MANMQIDGTEEQPEQHGRYDMHWSRIIPLIITDLHWVAAGPNHS